MNINNIIKSAFIKNYKIKLVAYFGLVISFTALLFGISFYRTETSYDTFHTNADRLYRLTLKPKIGPEDAMVMKLERERLVADIPEIEDIVRISRFYKPQIICKDQVFTKESVFSTDSSFFYVFSFPLKRGIYNTLYEKPKSIVLTSEFAIRLFGHDNVIGETLKLTTGDISMAELYTVRGILQNFPPNSHISAAAFTCIPREVFESYTYLLLHKSIDPKKVEKKLDDFYKKTSIGTLQNIKDIHLYSSKLSEIKNNGSISSLRIVVISCLLLFIISMCNYIIISWITNVKDLKTIQLKRIVGAKFLLLIIDEVVAQIIVVLSIIAIGTLLFSSINHVNVFTNKDIFHDIIMLFVAFVIAAIISACIPFSRLYYKLRKTNIIRQTNSSTIQVLAIFQITIAIGLIAASIFVTRQMNFIYQNQIGGTETNLLVLKDLTWDEMKIYGQLKQELPKHACVLGVCQAGGTPGNGIKDNGPLLTNGKDSVSLNTLSADHNFAEFFNIRLIAGTYLPEYNYSKDWEESHFDPRTRTGPSPGTDYYLVNRKTVDMLGFKNPNDILGMSVKSDLFSDGRIVGVIEDFHFGSIFEKEIPLLIKQRSWLPSTVFIRYNKNEEQTVIKLLKQQWNQQIPNCLPKYTFITDIYNNIYQNEKQTFHLILLISMLCISLSVLGLISITAYTTIQRTKEIGIRRVNGSHASEILFLLNKDIVIWVFIAFIIACPIVWYIMHKWLQNFAYKTELSWWVFPAAGVITMVIVLLTVSWQSWRAATRNPVEALRYE